MMRLAHPIYWLRARLSGARVSSSAIVRGIRNIRLGKDCRVGRQVEINASSGMIDVGAFSSVGPFSILEARGGNICIGAHSSIGPFCVLYGHGDLTIGSDCMIAAYVVFIPENHRFNRSDVPMREQGGTRQGIRIGDDVWLATRVVVLDGVSIGKGAVVGAGAVVTRDIPPNAIAYGVPAKVVGYRGQSES